MVYDLTLSDSFHRVKKWIEELKAFNKNTVLAIAGNKIDLSHKAEVEREEVLAYAKEENAKLFYTSAKTGEGLDDIFHHVTERIASQEQSSKADLNTPSGKNKRIIISKCDTATSDKNKAKCC